ncbi:hypothetical protein HPB51_005173 [Rhipicephalus microplus]|uniref:Carboxylesterase type B domain-containing protein n=1 Tax=Rhipicephalus microplus TaxID=6941 RepID=A0A9J6DLL6_RHIMP|nr:hypothetical protein HPB51_005173 [Rhipicephalus microplus]
MMNGARFDRKRRRWQRGHVDWPNSQPMEAAVVVPVVAQGGAVLVICVACLVAFLLSAVPLAEYHPLVRQREVTAMTSLGAVTGVRVSVFNRDVVVFYGVPYADAPLGTDRFSAPSPGTPWSGYRDASEKVRDRCLQPAPFSMVTDNTQGYVAAENCLHVNVYAPDKAKNRSVLVILHGGEFQRGSNDDPMYDGRYMAAAEDVVVIVPNYRLNVFGFLATPFFGVPGKPGPTRSARGTRVGLEERGRFRRQCWLRHVDRSGQRRRQRWPAPADASSSPALPSCHHAGRKSVRGDRESAVRGTTRDKGVRGRSLHPQDNSRPTFRSTTSPERSLLRWLHSTRHLPHGPSINALVLMPYMPTMVFIITNFRHSLTPHTFLGMLMILLLLCFYPP